MSPFSSFLTGALIFGVSPVLIFVLTRFVTKMTAAEPNLPRYLSWLVPLALALWFLSANVVGFSAGFKTTGIASPAGLLMLVIPMLVVMSVLFLTRPATRLLQRMPPDWLIGIQVYRTTGFLLLYLYFHDNYVARGFALSAGIGDIFVGLTSIVVARWVRIKAPGYQAAAIIWNIAGIADLVLAPISALVAGFQGITSYPLVVVPLFLGPPLGIFMHAASLRNLYLLGRTGKDSAQWGWSGKPAHAS